jgi:hypothetical protein
VTLRGAIQDSGVAVNVAEGGTFAPPAGSTSSVMLCGGTVADSDPPL